MSVKRSTKVLTGAGFFEPGMPIYVNRAYESFELAEHSHEFVEITYVSEGAGVHYIAGATVPVEQGTLFFIPVGQSHVFRPATPAKERPLIVYNCLFPAVYLTELQAGFPQAAEVVAAFADPQLSWFAMKDAAGEYHAMFRELYREYAGRPPAYAAVLAALVVRILTGLYRYLLLHAAPSGAKPQWLTVEEAIAYIDQSFAAELRLGDIAARASLSERQFSRLFRRQTGMSFTAYVQNVRMDAACRLLVSGRSSVAEIAAAVGYADLKFFNLLFKKKTGVTPRQYRASNY
jgi:AraC-like DNA-binding protein